MDKTIMVVEDDADIRALLNIEFRASGYKTSFARDGTSAISLIRTNPPDLIVLDIGLPAGDGFTVMDRLSAFPALEGIPIVVVTASTSSQTRERALAAGAFAFIEKPFIPQALLKTIGQAFAPSTL